MRAAVTQLWGAPRRRWEPPILWTDTGTCDRASFGGARRGGGGEEAFPWLRIRRRGPCGGGVGPCTVGFLCVTDTHTHKHTASTRRSHSWCVTSLSGQRDAGERMPVTEGDTWGDTESWLKPARPQSGQAVCLLNLSTNSRRREMLIQPAPAPCGQGAGRQVQRWDCTMWDVSVVLPPYGFSWAAKMLDLPLFFYM